MNVDNEKYWRALILFGKNSSTYKMALGKCLLDYSEKGRDKVSLDDLASDFYNLYVDRVKNKKPQGLTSGRQTYVEQAINDVLWTGRPQGEALEIIKKKSLKEMVLQKFHNFNEKPLDIEFYRLSDGEQNLILDKNLMDLPSSVNYKFFETEISSRWALLEHAFYDIHKIESLDVDAYLKHIINAEKRIVLTSLIDTLEGYQQGLCFYCAELLYDIEVDHLIPYNALKHNQIWNLVLSHSFCNQDKSDNLPPKHYVERLITRNEYFIQSSHPIKDTLVKQLGGTQVQRRQKILSEYHYATDRIRRIWHGSDSYDPSNDDLFKMAGKLYWFQSSKRQ